MTTEPKRYYIPGHLASDPDVINALYEKLTGRKTSAGDSAEVKKLFAAKKAELAARNKAPKE